MMQYFENDKFSAHCMVINLILDSGPVFLKI